MTDEQISDLDRRARAAASGLQAAVADRPVPAFDPDVVRIALDDGGPGGAHRWRAVAGVAAALLLVLGAVALFSSADDDDSAPADRVGMTTVRRFVATDLPPGFEVFSVSDPEVGADGEVPGQPENPLLVYGPDEAHPGLIVGAATSADEVDFDSVEEDEEEMVGGELLDLGGRRAQLVEATGIGVQYLTVEIAAGGPQVVLLAPDRAVLEAVATSVEVEGDRPVVAAAALPDGWAPVGELDDPMAGMGAVAGMRGTSAGGFRIVAYSGGEESFLAVSAGPGGALEVGLGRLYADVSEPIEVRGREGVLSRLDADPEIGLPSRQWTVTWEERPGEVVRVQSMGVSRDEVLAVAEGLRVADAEEWRDLARQGLRSGLTGGAEVVGEGTFADGAPWALLVEDYGDGGGLTAQLRTTVSADSSSGSSSDSGSSSGFSGDGSGIDEGGTATTISGGAGPSSPPPTPAFLDGVTVQTMGARQFAYGLLRDDVATVDLVDGDERVLLTVEVLRGGGHHGWVMEATEVVEGCGGCAVVARAADGTELGRDRPPFD